MSTTYGPTPATDRDIDAAFWAGEAALEAAENTPGDAEIQRAAGDAVSAYVAASRSADRASYGPDVATGADASRATMRSAGTLADPSASWDDRQAALEAEAAAYDTHWQAYGIPAYAQNTARKSLAREHAARALNQIGAGHQADAGDGGPEAGE